MQNTGTNTPGNTASTLTEPRVSSAPQLKITISQERDAHPVQHHKAGFLRRMLMLCTRILPSRRKDTQPAAVTAAAPLQQTSVTLQEKHIKHIENNILPLNPQPHIPATSPTAASGDAYLRKLAEQQFWEMDITQVTRN
ncbi:MAG TPA: hypothetical protein VFT64_07990 [Rickettsiales bacterium]|nr:hypothetical protein [Rickettsiales bacterium]